MENLNTLTQKLDILFYLTDSKAFAATTSMSLIGVSHAASEFLVMKTQMVDWFTQNCDVKAMTIPYSHWWR